MAANVISVTSKDKEIWITISGKVDSSNAPETEKAIFEKIKEQSFSPEKIVLDAEELQYISSAGLRILLKLKKTCAGFMLINASSEVYDILEMTGFTEMMEVKKAFRKINVNGCEVIGTGAYGNVYRLNGDTIVKVYEQGRSAGLDFIKREQEVSRKAFVYGLPTAISFDVVKVEEDYGVVYEMLDAETLGDFLTKNPDKLDVYIEKLAALAHQIHDIKIKEGEFQDSTTVFTTPLDGVRGILSQEVLDHFLALISALPKGNSMVHGDFHTKNVMVNDGELELIDMGDLSVGHPVLDFCSLHMLHQRVSTNPEMAKFMGMPVELALQVEEKYLKAYFKELGTEENLKLLEKGLDIMGILRAFPISIGRISSMEMPEDRKQGILAGRIKELMDMKLEDARDTMEKIASILY